MRVPSFRTLLLALPLLVPAISQASVTPSITINPGTATLSVGQTIQFAAKVVGLKSTAVIWKVEGLTGGNSSLGTISTSGLYQAPATVAGNANTVQVTAVGSDGKTTGTVSVALSDAGPAITYVAPNPLSLGRYKVTLHGSGFEPGASVRNGSEMLQAVYVSSTVLEATGNQAGTKSAVFQVKNPTSAWGAGITVPFVAHGELPTITPATVYVRLGSVQRFTAATANYWTTTAGNITDGLYQAPAVMPKSPDVTITATGPGGTASATITLVSGEAPVIAPGSVTLELGQKQQFTSNGSKTWSATYGTISATGLYTAPATWPANGLDEIFVNGIHGTGSEKISITPPIPVVTAAGNGGNVPLGVFQISVLGRNFSSTAVVNFCGANLKPANFITGGLVVSGFCGHQGPTALTVTNGNATSAPFPVQVGLANPKVSAAAARRFLEQGAFGPNPNDAEAVQAVGFQGWLKAQYQMPAISNYRNITTTYGGIPQQFLTNAVNQPDQLRQRVAFALSQIFVTSLNEIPNQTMVSYQDMLLTDAFSNYRKIMEDVALSPAMGQYLNMANNAKADPATGSLANENFAREVMQLFSLGVNLLNDDGSVQFDSNGIPLPTYSQFNVTEFARVFTGWTYAPKPGKPVEFWAQQSDYGPLVAYPMQHDTGSKQLLNGYVIPSGQSPKEDMDAAVGNIFDHPNAPPFVARLLIQHLVKSNPSPGYITRVAEAFKNNGSGVRGDMTAVISAILLDPEARANDDGGSDQATDGHLQEPALFTAGMVRAFGGHMDDRNYYQWYLANMGQDIFTPETVFNYYVPDFSVPGTTLMGGEFQIDSPNNAVERANLVSGLFGQWSGDIQTFGPGTTVDLTGFVNLAGDPAKLVDALDLTLTHGVMPTSMKEAIVTAVNGETGGNLRRVQRGVYLILTSSYYNVWH